MLGAFMFGHVFVILKDQIGYAHVPGEGGENGGSLFIDAFPLVCFFLIRLATAALIACRCRCSGVIVSLRAMKQQLSLALGVLRDL
jgi:hypothetical protein